ncbi:hypothetical protein CES85_4871 [Ochrobactrum quorumnocens]|uniref:Uncharacterized protein n=1 Tax=Ochrobactrum quorumnocens TaxID=271865 RepID=A0A248UCL8_9HYPH|nr:hypothetical protein CES85_4871 [[Ochrobactrum] quorumnocens]
MSSKIVRANADRTVRPAPFAPIQAEAAFASGLFLINVPW